MLTTHETIQFRRDHGVFEIAEIHSYSLLRALAYGCVPLVSDAFGYEEYVEPIRESVLSITGVQAQVYRLQNEGWMADHYRPFVKAGGYCEDQIYALLAQHLDRRNLKEFAARNVQYCRKNFDPKISHQAFNKMLGL